MAVYRPRQRAALVSGLLELAGFLDSHPVLPLPVVPELRVADTYQRADVAANDVAFVAELLGSDPRGAGEVSRWFGEPGGLLYTFSAVTVPEGLAGRACVWTGRLPR